MHSGSYSSAERRSHDEDIRESRQDRSTSREEHRSSHFTSRMLLTKNAAKETETDALIIRNRIALLEKEEQKLLKHIDETKKRALDIISKKNRNKEIHNERDKKLEERAREIEVKRVQIINKKEELKERVQSALESRSLTSKEKAFEIKENMKKLKDKYKEQQQKEQVIHMEQVKDIKAMEMLVQSKKEEHLRTIQNLARERYESQIRAQEEARNKLEDEIQRLVSREQELMDKVKKTQTYRQLCLQDLDRIINDEKPQTLEVEEKHKPVATKRFK